METEEIAVEAGDAHSLLEPDEIARVYAFVDGSPTKRSLLKGSVDGDTFLDTFLVLDNEETHELIRDGRNLRAVVQVIRNLGGLTSAARRIPWLQKVVRLADALDFDRLSKRLIFVRAATAEEAQSSRPRAGSSFIYIEEGQHRAIAAALNLLQNSTHSVHSALSATTSGRMQSLSYLRGVNLLGHASGDAFWDVADRRPSFSTPGCACALLLLWLQRRCWRARRHLRRRQSSARGAVAGACGAGAAQVRPKHCKDELSVSP